MDRILGALRERKCRLELGETEIGYAIIMHVNNVVSGSAFLMIFRLNGTAWSTSILT